MPNDPKLTPADAIAIRKAIASGRREAELAREYGVTRSTINLIKQNRLHANIGVDVSGMTRQRRSAENAETLERMISEGKSAKVIAKTLGVARSTVTGIKKRQLPGTPPFRRQYRHRRIVGKKLSFEKAEQIRELRRKGATVRELAEQFGVQQNTIYQILEYKIWKSESSK